MKTDKQYPSTPLEKEAVQYVANDDLAMFADDDTRMIYEHYYIKGYEKAVAQERERIKEKVRKLMFTMPTGRVPREGLNIAFYKVLELVDSL